ncbi:MAG: hypothetical protein JKX85_05455 [Phycisphaeraceae bacterium]|nr:hypothetical protein [Phycisphaeraceae bacterium]
MSAIFKRLGTGALVMVSVTVGCSTSSPQSQYPADQTSAMTEREYLAFRASHAGQKVEPNELKMPEQAAIVTIQHPPVAAVTPVVKSVPQPVVTAAARVKSTPVPTPAPTHAPKPVTVAVAVVKTPSPAPVPAAPKPVIKPVAATVAPKPVPVAAVAKPAPVVAVTKPAPVKVAQAKPVAKRPRRQPQLVSNTSLSASDGFLSRRHQVTSSEKAIKPIHRPTPKRMQETLPLPTMQQLVEDGKPYDASIVLKQINTANLASIAQAIRIVIKEKPRNGTSLLYDVIRYAKAAAPRAMAIDALFQAYPQNATYSAQKLLQQTRYNRIDRLVVGNRIMQYRISRTYGAAITNLGYDASGKAMFDARRGILAADKAVTQALKNYAARASIKHASFIARRLYHWIRNDETIKQAYEDTFVKHPSELGVVMFRERFGDEALPLLKQASSDANKKLRAVVQREITKLSDKTSTPALLFGYHKLYIINYQTPQGAFALLSDQTIWPDQAVDETYQQKDAKSSFSQKVLMVKTKELQEIKNLPNNWKSGVKIHGHSVDTLDLK